MIVTVPGLAAPDAETWDRKHALLHIRMGISGYLLLAELPTVSAVPGAGTMVASAVELAERGVRRGRVGLQV